MKVVGISGLILEQTSAVPAAAARETIECAFRGFQKTGFVVLTGHGLTPEAVNRQFDLANMFLSVSEETKHRYHAKIHEEGSWAGYKPQGFFKRKDGTYDTTEFHDFYPDTVVEDLQPPESWSYLKEIRAFYKVIPRRQFKSQGSAYLQTGGAPGNIQTKDLFRGAMYHPPTEEDRAKANQLWLPSHTDR
ncbi:hypothetical protein DXG01_012921 [Tephrocybe rancida]|nr:hypothetical protein DXG01_012921 [Tephrocybe rancida]